VCRYAQKKNSRSIRETRGRQNVKLKGEKWTVKKKEVRQDTMKREREKDGRE
jgi:hypothetical protein